MRAYRTYLTINDPKQVVFLDVPFRAGQEVEVVFLAKEENSAAQVSKLKQLFKITQALPQAQALSEEEILQEVAFLRSGQ